MNKTDNLKFDPNRWSKDKKYKEYADNRKDVSPYSNPTKRCEAYDRVQTEWVDLWGSPKDEFSRSEEAFLQSAWSDKCTLGEDDMK